MLNYKKTASICLVNKNKEILMHLRDDKPSIPYPNFWSLISGVVEEGETPEETVKREVKEEIGYAIKDIDFMDKILLEKNKFLSENNEIYIFKGFIDIPAEKIELTEGQEVGFFKFDKLRELKIIPCFKEFIFRNKEKIFI